ncbi:GNAT family N-acetyltransferase [Brachybacterium sp. NBEC-018]|uniref:GNAT family N-acetyltransferase n=1 Tax=Brachybacterium sp. NBEC-018 TaxID=2996004 RepID=UPI0021752EFE|nr:GNAT family N-acetyltransferase [Brachybacterium sp. NBEC-018]UVY83972.1 GNAT family N-acetyltransferase [Brachybacterium sp. NBEC-018]
MHVTIRPLDLSSDAELIQYNALDEALDLDAFGGVQPFTLAQRRSTLEDTPYHRSRRWVAIAETIEGGEQLVGRAGTFEPLQDNLEMISVGCAVHPAFRGRGIGTALVEEALLPAIRESGRPLVDAWGEIGADGDPDEPSLPANRIAARLGVSRKNIGVCRALTLPLDAGMLDELRAQAEEKLGDYRIEIWEDPVPEEHLASYGALLRQLDLDDPDEDLEYEAPEYTPERIRTSERRRAEQGILQYQSVAIAPDGTVAGNSVIHLKQGEEATLGWQENTLVMPDHRGHHLGLALKVATHRELAARAPHVRRLITFNSHVNPWMIAINEQLGYEVAFREVGYQGRQQPA